MFCRTMSPPPSGSNSKPRTHQKTGHKLECADVMATFSWDWQKHICLMQGFQSLFSHFLQCDLFSALMHVEHLQCPPCRHEKKFKRLKDSLPYTLFIISYASLAVLPNFKQNLTLALCSTAIFRQASEHMYCYMYSAVTFKVRTHDAVMLAL
jgi:hypothetical protein